MPPLLRRLRALSTIGRIIGGQPLEPDQVAWGDTLRLADEELVTTAIAASLRSRPELLPNRRLADHLTAVHRQNLARNLLLRRQASDAVRTLNRAGIEPLLFKGAQYLLDGTYRDIGARLIADIDIAVRAAERDAAVEALRADGYTDAPGAPFLHPHELPMVAAGRVTAVELHTELGSVPLAGVLPAAEAWSTSTVLRIDGACARGLSPSHAVLHNVLHAQVQDLNHAVLGLPLRQLHTLLELVRMRGPQIEWAAIVATMERHGLDGMLSAYLDLAHRLFGMPVPPAVVPAPRWRSHATLLMFELRWPADLHRNLRFALGREYLDHLYGHGGRPLRLFAARARHLCRVGRVNPRAAFSNAMRSRR